MLDKILLGFAFGIAFMCTLLAFTTILPMEKENAALRAQLDDPHHCVSVCVEQFEKMEC